MKITLHALRVFALRVILWLMPLLLLLLVLLLLALLADGMPDSLIIDITMSLGARLCE